MDAMSLPANDRCPVARSLTVLGQKWSLLLLREAFFGRTRFAEFSRIGIPSDVLAARLESLVAAGLLVRRPYQADGARARDEYVLTDAGRDVLPVLAALTKWGYDHVPSAAGETMRFVRDSDEEALKLRFVDAAGEIVDERDVAIRRLLG
jgi:DNA-binding HxlR family transcriptional regulator